MYMYTHTHLFREFPASDMNFLFVRTLRSSLRPPLMTKLTWNSALSVSRKSTDGMSIAWATWWRGGRKRGGS